MTGNSDADWAVLQADGPARSRSSAPGDGYLSLRYLAATTGTGDPFLVPLLDLGWDLQQEDPEVMWNHLRG
ncbi:hypothetical protein G7Z12_37240 [Streptomyces sp. ID38640]|uniref:hypothetical protein n=1 Tax=Streptomyces sp. ID38640 TaxID=1265399 RepID=UPI00140ED17F|nr:hypothetical protein [Streptomyces sp. ID38640]QIK04705.1 hypothetical protein G7Z12_37240 [Streptomyces sp. ID38640]